MSKPDFSPKYLLEKIKKLTQERDKLKECVEFYADRDNWKKQNQTANTICANNDKELMSNFRVYFGGKLARQTLKEFTGTSKVLKTESMEVEYMEEK